VGLGLLWADSTVAACVAALNQREAYLHSWRATWVLVFKRGGKESVQGQRHASIQRAAESKWRGRAETEVGDGMIDDPAGVLTCVVDGINRKRGRYLGASHDESTMNPSQRGLA
jgi:hypothetical protein